MDKLTIDKLIQVLQALPQEYKDTLVSVHRNENSVEWWEEGPDVDDFDISDALIYFPIDLPENKAQ